MAAFTKQPPYNIDDLREIVAILRGENGCPWDMEQTHESIRSGFVEEVYEAIEAINLGNTELLREELGDVLLQVAFHCQIEQEENRFDFDDVCDEICRKLIHRHPHVFGDLSVTGTDEVLKNWDAIKQKSKGQTFGDTLSDVAASLPALMRAQKVGKRAARAGMDFNNADEALACIESETKELKEAIASNDQDRITEEFGDLLFSCVNTARHLHIESEQALTDATDKFIRRFRKTEELVGLDGIAMQSLSIEALDVYWHRAKEIVG